MDVLDLKVHGRRVCVRCVRSLSSATVALSSVSDVAARSRAAPSVLATAAPTVVLLWGPVVETLCPTAVGIDGVGTEGADEDDVPYEREEVPHWLCPKREHAESHREATDALLAQNNASRAYEKIGGTIERGPRTQMNNRDILVND
ncbi:hypothetical protein BP5796_09093 [Coleophoma crateriformis]|uniref:Uncharacterized protein n=1 Tax=Coleophoma crateriformis TaxID=565419 RepID=A0A3D8R381_9HELO|nr:hypothetical protein BP5796_09093 [Coleophoma crateriformis]